MSMSFYVSLELASITAKVLFILLIGWLTSKKFTFAGAISNGVLMILGGGTLLWAQHVLGYVLLVYGAFLMTAGMREQEVLELTGKTEGLGVVLRYMGHHITAAFVLQAAALYCFWPF